MNASSSTDTGHQRQDVTQLLPLNTSSNEEIDYDGQYAALESQLTDPSNQSTSNEIKDAVPALKPQAPRKKVAVRKARSARIIAL